jgi:hypothetical protein
MTRVVVLSGYARGLLVALAEQGVPVDQFHPEYAAGQLAPPVTSQNGPHTRHHRRPRWSPHIDATAAPATGCDRDAAY